MINNILMILLTILGFNFGPKYDLHKKPTFEDRVDKVREWITLNFSFIALAAVIILMVFFVWFCFFVTGVSATEDGIYFLEKVI